MTSVSINAATKRFGNTVAFDRITLRIEAGELFFLLGPSGCGKTTLLRAIAGLVALDEGTIAFGDEEVTRIPAHRRGTAMMFQSYALWPHMSVAQNVAFGLEERSVPKGEIKRRVDEALASAHMADYAARKPNQLSGGQQQRVALARALVVRPRCLLLDEPLSNLDARLRLEMRSEIRRVCKESGLTAIYVTHDQKEALSIADRIAILNAGQIAQVGTPREVYRRPQSRFVASFIGDTNFIPGKVVATEKSAARVTTAVGEFTGVLSPETATTSVGARVALSIRPESWRMDGTPGTINNLTGQIVERTFLGEIAQYRVVAGAVAVTAYELNPRLTDNESSDTRHLHVAPEDVVVLPERA